MLIPDVLIEDRSLLKTIFVTEAKAIGYSESDANLFFQNLPNDIQRAAVEKYKLGSTEWRYVYGSNFHIGRGHGLGIPWQRPLVSNLIHACYIAQKYLTKFQYNEWRKHLRAPAKHFSAISEMIVVKNLRPENKLFYEKKYSGLGNTRIDWELESQNHIFLLEVKVRPGQVATHLERESQKNQFLPSESIPKIEKLFVETYTKFKPKVEKINFQGVALFLGLKVPKKPFEDYFLKVLHEKLHFVALVAEDGRHVNLVADSDEMKKHVLSEFGWINDADFFLEET